MVADPPWQYDTGSSLPYPTMPIDEIKAIPVQNLADENSTLWLWTTNAHLPVAFDVIRAWGFEYKTILTWVKDRMGTGEWLRGQTEHCLLGTRGKPVFLRGSDGTVLEAARREHSRKPEAFYALVERVCPAAEWNCSRGSSGKDGSHLVTTPDGSSSQDAICAKSPETLLAQHLDAR